MKVTNKKGKNLPLLQTKELRIRHNNKRTYNCFRQKNIIKDQGTKGPRDRSV